MFKRCDCGEEMSLGLRTVYYAKTVNIRNVPVYACEACSRNVVFPGVKSDLSQLLASLGPKPQPGSISFDEVHEWAGVLSEAAARRAPLLTSTVSRMAQERTNDLLDLLLVAAAVGDESWKRELESRLTQLSGQFIS